MKKHFITILSIFVSISFLTAQDSSDLDNIDGLMMLGKIYKAYDTADELVKKDANNSRAFYERAKIIEILYSIHKRNHGNIREDETSKQVDRIFNEIGNNEAIEKQITSDLNKAISLKVDYEAALELRAKFSNVNGNLNDALNDYNKLISLKPKSVFNLLERGKILFKLNKLEDSKEDFHTVIFIGNNHHGNIESHYYLGKIHFINEEFKKTIEELNHLPRKSEETFMLRGTSYLAVGNFVDGCADLQKLQNSTEKDWSKLYDFHDCNTHYLNNPDFKKGECRQFQTGNFKYSQYSKDQISIVRTESQQIETYKNGTVEYDINWTSKNEYILTVTKTTIENLKHKIGTSTNVRITDVKNQSYSFETIIDGVTLKGTFIKL